MDDTHGYLENGATPVWDACVLGAGVAGLTAAHEMSQLGMKVAIVDASTRCGGSHRSHQIGPYTYDVGSVFFTQGHPFFEIFPGLRDMCPDVRRTQRRLAPDGRVHHYPFNPREVFSWPIGTQIACLADLGYRRLMGGDGEHVQEVCINRIGKVAYTKSGLEAYIQRFNRISASEIDPSFFNKRMGQVLARSNLSALGKAAWKAMGSAPTQKQKPRLLVRPREGFDVLYDKVRGDLEARGVTFFMDQPVKRLLADGDRMVIELPGRSITTPLLIGAVPIDVMHRAAFGTGTGLESINLLTLFVSVDHAAEELGNVFYNFHHSGRWKRATIYSRIYGLADGREYFAVEIPFHTGAELDPEEEFQELRSHMSALNLVGSDMRLEGQDIVDAAYPLLRVGCADITRQAVDRLAEFGVTPVGRQGRFDYLPTSTQVISQTRANLADAGLIAAQEPR